MKWNTPSSSQLSSPTSPWWQCWYLVEKGKDTSAIVRTFPSPVCASLPSPIIALKLHNYHHHQFNYQFKIITIIINSLNLWHTWLLTWADCHCQQVRANPHKHQKQSPRTAPGLFQNIIKIVYIKYLKYYTNIINTRGSHLV